MSKNLKNIIFIVLLFFLTVIALEFEKYKLVMIDTHVTDLKAEYEKIKSETNSIKYKINSILALEKLNKISEEKKFKTPSQEAIVDIKE